MLPGLFFHLFKYFVHLMFVQQVQKQTTFHKMKESQTKLYEKVNENFFRKGS